MYNFPFSFFGNVSRWNREIEFSERPSGCDSSRFDTSIPRGSHEHSRSDRKCYNAWGVEVDVSITSFCTFAWNLVGSLRSWGVLVQCDLELHSGNTGPIKLQSCKCSTTAQLPRAFASLGMSWRHIEIPCSISFHKYPPWYCLSGAR